MRRADRLFQIIQILRRSTDPITASRIAEELETSRRSVYRDIADLIGQRVPIRGEAGVGYVLDRDYDMPPLMLTPDELEAAVLGAQWVADKGDAVLAGAARDLIAKIAIAVPERLRPFVSHPSVGAPLSRASLPDGLDVARARASIRTGHKIRIRYR
ncbi:MAG: HTH domain-containing protein, partial [Mesorhizobium sp.]